MAQSFFGIQGGIDDVDAPLWNQESTRQRIAKAEETFFIVFVVSVGRNYRCGRYVARKLYKTYKPVISQLVDNPEVQYYL